MKSLLKVTLVLDDGTPIGGVHIEELGELSITVQRDEMGGLSIAKVEVKPTDGYQEAVTNSFDSLTVIHRKVVELEIALRTALTDMHWLSRYLQP